MYKPFGAGAGGGVAYGVGLHEMSLCASEAGMVRWSESILLVVGKGASLVYTYQKQV